MSAAHGSPMLSALEAVVIDTETTGLDARSARLVQYAGIRLRGAELLPQRRFETLVDPGVTIPAATTAIHGISDDNVRDAPSFAAVAPSIAEFQRDLVVIGHSIA